MTFFNKKEEVFQIELTPYGRYLLSIGRLQPHHYKFFDDDVVYNHSKSFSQIQPDGPILIARDTRSHGSYLSKIAINSILETGRDVSDYQIK